MMYGLTLAWAVYFRISLPKSIPDEEFARRYAEAFNQNCTYIYIISACMCLLIAALFFGMRRRSLADAANIKAAPPVRIISAFVCGLSLQIPLGHITAVLPLPESIFDSHNELMTASTSPLWAQFLYAIVFAPIAEEIFFRGIAQDRLAKAMPIPLAALLSSAAFVVIHADMISMAVAFVLGFLLALLYSRYKTVIVPIAFHIGFNLCAYAVSYLKDPVLVIAVSLASLGLLIGSGYLLLRKDEA